MFTHATDILQKVAPVEYILKNHKRRVIMVEPDGHHKDNAEQRHAIIHVTLKNSETYTVDIRGAQYGHYDSVIPKDLYVESRVDSIQEVQPLGSIKEYRKRMDKATKTDGCTKTIEEEIAEVFAAAATSWQVANGPLNAVLKVRKDHFVRKQAGLLDFIDRRVREHKARLAEEQGAGSGECRVKSKERRDVLRSGGESDYR